MDVPVKIEIEEESQCVDFRHRLQTAFETLLNNHELKEESSAFESPRKLEDVEEEVKPSLAIFLPPFEHEDIGDGARPEENFMEENHPGAFDPDVHIKEEIMSLSDAEIPDLEENQEASNGSPRYEDVTYCAGYSNILQPETCSEALNEPMEPITTQSPTNLLAMSNVKMRPMNTGTIFKCPDCDYVTYKSYSLREHYHLHTGQTPYKCSQCHFAFPTNIHLHNHIQRVHTAEPLHKCSQCSYTTKWRQALTRHEYVHTDVTNYKCSQCDYVTIYQNNLTSHEMKHTEEKPYKCSQCSYAAFSLYKLMKHIRTHADEQAFKCAECDYTSTTKSKLLCHKQIHRKGNPFKCSQCNFSTTQRSSLTQHERIHCR